MKIELGYWWPFARTAWGWVVATGSVLAVLNRGRKAMLDIWNSHLAKRDEKVIEYLETTITIAGFTPPGGGRLQSVAPKTVKEIADGTGLTEKRVRDCLKRLRKKKEVMCIGNDVWKLLIPHLVA